MSGSYDVAWAAGIFEGEGSVVAKGKSRATVTVKMCDREIIDRFHKVIRFGTVYGPYKNRAGEKDGYPRSDFYVWTCSVDDAPAVVEMIWPWLGSRRRGRVADVGLDPEITGAPSGVCRTIRRGGR